VPSLRFNVQVVVVTSGTVVDSSTPGPVRWKLWFSDRSS
jgi:hypothetical protein